MHKEHTTALWARHRRLPVVWGALLGEQAMHLVRLSRQAGARSLRVQRVEQLQAGAGSGEAGPPWWWPHMQRIARPAPSLWSRWPGLGWLSGPLALAWPQTRCAQGVLFWPGAADAPALQAEVHLEAAAALGLPPAEVVFDYQAPVEPGGGHPMSAPPTAFDTAAAPWPAHPPGDAAQPVHWAAAARTEVLEGQRQLRTAGWRVRLMEPEAWAARRAAECLLGEPSGPWALPVRDWQFAVRAQRSVSEAAWRALQDSPHWGPLAACGVALAVLA